MIGWQILRNAIMSQTIVPHFQTIFDDQIPKAKGILAPQGLLPSKIIRTNLNRSALEICVTLLLWPEAVKPDSGPKSWHVVSK